MELNTISSDDLISSYREQLSEAHHQIAVLKAQVNKAARIFQEQSEEQAQREKMLADIKGDLS